MFDILALDQSTKCTGWAFINEKGLKKYGKIEANTKDNVVIRLEYMYKQISELVDTLNPSYVVFEGTQYQNNAMAFSLLSRLQGLIMAILFDRKLGFFIIQPTAWKSFCHITGRKREIQKENTKIFVANKYSVIVSEDEADAIGIATWAINNIKKEITNDNI